MSDTLSHATQGGLILLGPFIHRIRRRTWIWVLALVGAFFGALPDLLRTYGYWVRHDHGELAHSAHQGAIAETLQYVPMYWLHLRLDDLTRERESLITAEWIWLEVILWSVNLALIWWYVKIWRKNKESILPTG